MTSLENLYKEYSKERSLKLSQEQFMYLVNLFPALRVALSDGVVDEDEWVTVKRLAEILGDEFSSEEPGEDKKENLMLIYKAEFRYLIKNIDSWEDRFLDALREQLKVNEASREFVMETMYLFAHASDGVSDEEMKTIEFMTEELKLDRNSIL